MVFLLIILSISQLFGRTPKDRNWGIAKSIRRKNKENTRFRQLNYKYNLRNLKQVGLQTFKCCLDEFFLSTSIQDELMVSRYQESSGLDSNFWPTGSLGDWGIATKEVAKYLFWASTKLLIEAITNIKVALAPATTIIYA